MLSPKPHQAFVIQFAKNIPNQHTLGLLLDHSTGSGKTLTSLLSMYQHDEPITVVGPKSCNPVFTMTIQQAGLDPDRVRILTYTTARQLAFDHYDVFQDQSVIVDEAHALRSQTMANSTLLSALASAKRIILTSATPFVNHFADLAVLTNLLQRSDRLPIDRRLFDALYIRDSTLVNQDILASKIGPVISYYSMLEDQEYYPTRKERYIPVVMDTKQIDKYRAYIKKFKYAGNELEVSQAEDLDFLTMPSKTRNAFLTTTRQISNTGDPSTPSPKMLRIVSEIKASPGSVLVYSTYLDYGIFSLAIILDRENIPYLTINGYSTPTSIAQTIAKYNRGMTKVLLISSAGSESLDLKATRQLHIMEPHWNDPKIDQVIGRAIRYGSHSMLPYRDREVTIYRWVSVFPDHIRNQSADEYLVEVSRIKSALVDQYRALIADISIEGRKK